MQTQRIETMRFHGPGWTLDLGERDDATGEVVVEGESYQLWGPQTEIVQDERFPGLWSADNGVSWHYEGKVPRDHWAACWSSGDGESGDFVRGETSATVLGIFPVEIARQFRTVIDAVLDEKEPER